MIQRPSSPTRKATSRAASSGAPKRPIGCRGRSAAASSGVIQPVSVTPGHVAVGDGYAATFVVCGYPAEVGPAWLDPLLSYPGRVDVAVHVAPVAPQLAAPMLKRQRARLESSRRLDADSGRLGDPMTDAAADLTPALIMWSSSRVRAWTVR